MKLFVLVSFAAFGLLAGSACNKSGVCSESGIILPRASLSLKLIFKDRLTNDVLYGNGLRYSPDSVRGASYSTAPIVLQPDTVGEDGPVIFYNSGEVNNPCTGEFVMNIGTLDSLSVLLDAQDTDTIVVRRSNERGTEFFYNGETLLNAGFTPFGQQTLTVFK